MGDGGVGDGGVGDGGVIAGRLRDGGVIVGRLRDGGRGGCEQRALRGVLAEPIDDTGVDVVDGADYAEFAFSDAVADLLAVGERRGDRLEDILADGERNEILVAHARVGVAGALDGGNDVVDEAGDASV